MRPTSNINRSIKPVKTRRLASAILATSLLASLATRVHADFNYPDFSSIAGLTLNGDAVHAGSVLRVTPNLQGMSGSAWYTTSKQHVADGFDTTFGITMGGDMAGDGMAFVIQDDTSTALGAGGSDLGYGGIPRSLVIEFDTFGFFPETDNHISVQTRGINQNSPEDQYSLAQVNINAFDLNDGTRHDFLIRYRPGVLLIFADGSNSPILDIALDLQNIVGPGVNGDDILDGSGDAWVGFTAGTGAATETHDVEFWSFSEVAFPLPSGPCCTTTGCVIATAHDCKTQLNGFYAGPDNGLCEDTDCIGSCCTNGSCAQNVALTDCVNGGGTFLEIKQQLGTGCENEFCEGACCDQFGVCFITSQDDCEVNNSGTWHGPGTSCGPFPCTLPQEGACCINNECLQMDEAECSNQSGTWYGTGTNCLDVNCFEAPPNLGACCQPGNTCVDGVAENVCTHFNGVYNGDDSLCANTDCAGSCDCQSAVVLPDNSFDAYSTTGAPVCDGGSCASSSPANIFSYTPSQDGYGLFNTCNGSNFDTVISVHSGCPMTPANLIICDTSTCGQDAQVYFCVEQGQTYYIRVGGEGGASGDYNLLAILLVADITDGPFQYPPGTGHWYYVTTQAPWTNLEALAVSKGGHLVTINDAAENEFVRSNWAAGTAVSIGINDAANEGTFVWPNGDPVGYTNWASGEPNGPSPEDDHGLMLDDGTWRDETSCYAGVYRGVIEVNTVPLPGVLAGPFNNPANCHDYYILNQGTWIEAQLQAEAMGGDLVTIDNALENEWVRSNLANFGQPRAIWIGLADRNVEGTFAWESGTALGYTNWTAGEPNNLGNEDYVEMNDTVTGSWNDAHSGLNNWGVVELPTPNCPCTCWGDVNGDASVRGTDIQRFVQCFIAAAGGPPTPGCNCADVNHDGFVNAADIAAMANAALNAPNCAP